MLHHVSNALWKLSPMNHGLPRSRPGLRAVAAAAVAVCSLTYQPAWALALGKVTVVSRLGEPLRAEVDLPSITEDEAASLQVRAAGLEAHRSANMELGATTSELRFELQRKPDGRMFILIRGPRPLNDPFVEILLQADWSGGRLVRGYTLLIDPPTTRSRPVQSSAVSTPVASPQATSKSIETNKTSTPSPVERGVGTATVRPGDTTSQVAERHLPEGVTRDQMMLGLLKANPNAFYENNVNRLKAGSVLKLPPSTELTTISPEQARGLMAAQNREFNEYRRALASSAVASAPDAAPRQASGPVQTEAPVATPTAPAQDKLELSKAEMPSAEQPPADASQQPTTDTADSAQQLAQAMARIEQLTRDIETLKQQKAATAPAETPPSSASAIMRSLLDQPLLPALGAALVALLGWLGWRLKTRQTSLHGLVGDSSLFGTAKGQSVDTRAEAPVSSMLYSPSQLDAGGDVDPIAEADVYLAYGRDGQAEEILVDALLQQPDRIPVRLKLLDIYAQRKDPVAYGQAAAELSPMMAHASSDWQHVCSVGRTLDPENPLYQDAASRLTSKTASATAVMASKLPAETVSSPPPPEVPTLTPPAAPAVMEPLPPISAPPATAASAAPLEFELPSVPPAPAPTPAPEAPQPAAADMSLDFDLSQFGKPAASPAQAPAATPAVRETNTSMDFDLDLESLAAAPAPQASAPAALPEDIRSLSLDLDLGDQPTGASTARSAPDSTVKAGPSTSEIDFDLDLTDATGTDDEALASHNPLEIKLSLAKEFAALGDLPGARALVQTVIDQSEGELQQRARDLLAQRS